MDTLLVLLLGLEINILLLIITLWRFMMDRSFIHKFVWFFFSWLIDTLPMVTIFPKCSRNKTKFGPVELYQFQFSIAVRKNLVGKNIQTSFKLYSTPTHNTLIPITSIKKLYKNDTYCYLTNLKYFFKWVWYNNQTYYEYIIILDKLWFIWCQNFSGMLKCWILFLCKKL